MGRPLKIDESKARVIRRWWQALCDEYAPCRARKLRSDEAVGLIRELKKKHLSTRLIAAVIGVSPGVVSGLCTRERIRLTGSRKVARNRYIARDLLSYCS